MKRARAPRRVCMMIEVITDASLDEIRKAKDCILWVPSKVCGEVEGVPMKIDQVQANVVSSKPSK